MSSNRVVVCSLCNSEMNHHADKVSYYDPEPDIYDSVYDGVLEEYYACPNCGNSLNVIVSKKEV